MSLFQNINKEQTIPTTSINSTNRVSPPKHSMESKKHGFLFPRKQTTRNVKKTTFNINKPNFQMKSRSSPVKTSCNQQSQVANPKLHPKSRLYHAERPILPKNATRNPKSCFCFGATLWVGSFFYFLLYYNISIL